LTDTTVGVSPNWTANQFQGKYVYIYGTANNNVTGAGQARAIVSNGGASLTVTPAFAPVAGSPNYVITESRGYVLITSGRATNRVFPIAWDAIDNATNTTPADGHLIVCAGTDFTALNAITAAQSGSQYNLQNATTFTVIGNYGAPFTISGTFSGLTWPIGSGSGAYASPPYPSMPLILNAIPDGTAIISTLWAGSPQSPAPLPWPPPPWFNTMNICTQAPYNAGTVLVTQGSASVTGTGTAWVANNVGPGNFFAGPDGALHRIASVASNTSLTLADNYQGPTTPNPPGYSSYTVWFGPPNRVVPDQFNVLTQGGGAYTSEYSYGVIFSDSGMDATLPVRVDVFVWRNFDPTRDFVENQKPVGHMTGYIKRP
jgi:hypothetical protein